MSKSPASKSVPEKSNRAAKNISPDSLLAAFDYQPRTRLVFGANSVERVGELAVELGAKRVLLVTDPGIVSAGHARRVQDFLLKHVAKVAVYDRVRENPTTSDVEACVRIAKKEKVDFFVGLGGGSSMDTAKGCNFILTNGGRMQDYWGVEKAKKPMLPLIAIPTTAGTGSECQRAALITDETSHQKMACLDAKAAARVAILDPVLTLSQPPRVTACTGIDAIAHAVETAVTTKRHPLSLIFSAKAFQLCAVAFSKVLKNPNDLDARGKMLLGAAFAGTAIENSMLGAAHASANPLTAHYGIVHGHAVGLMLPHVVRFNLQLSQAEQGYAEMLNAGCGVRSAAELPKFLESLLKIAGLPASLSDCGVKRSKIPSLAEEAAQQWTATFNPRPISKGDFLNLYESAF